MKIDINNKEEIQKFYQIAVDIRQRNALSFPFFSDNKNLEQINFDTDGNAAFFILEKGDKKARAGAYFYSNTNLGYIGWYESDDDDLIANEVLELCVAFLHRNNIKEIFGPMNGSTFYNYRFNLTSDKPAFPSEPFQPLYYIHQWESFGFKISESYITTYSEFPNIPMPDKEEVQKIFSSMNLSFEKLTTDLLKEIWRDFYDFLLISFQKNQHFSPISFEIFDSLMKEFPKVHDGEHSFIVFDVKRKPIGFVTCLNDLFYEYYQKNSVKDDLFSDKKLILKTIATHPEWQNKKVGTLIVSAILRMGMAEGFNKVIHALMWEENVSAKGTQKKFQSVPRVKYVLYKLEK